MNKAIICLGSNTPDADVRIAGAEKLVSSFGSVAACSGTYRTEPEYAGPTEPYLNEIIVLQTASTLEELKERTKAYEGSVRGSLPAGWKGLVNLDIDIVEWNGLVLRPADAASSYFRAGINRLTALNKQIT